MPWTMHLLLFSELYHRFEVCMILTSVKIIFTIYFSKPKELLHGLYLKLSNMRVKLINKLRNDLRQLIYVSVRNYIIDLR